MLQVLEDDLGLVRCLDHRQDWITGRIGARIRCPSGIQVMSVDGECKEPAGHGVSSRCLRDWFRFLFAFFLGLRESEAHWRWSAMVRT